MPLNTLPNRGSTGVDRYLHSREPVGVRPESRSLTPQPRRERSKQRANGAATRGARPNSSDGHAAHTSKLSRQDFAQSMKLPVPDTLSKARARPTNSLNHDNSTTKPISNVSQFRLPAESEINAFDDTQSIHFDDSTSIADGPETQRNVTFGFNNPQNQPNSLNPFKPEKQHFKAQRLAQTQGPEWQKRIDRSRVRPGEGPKYGNTSDREPRHTGPPSEEAYDDGYEPDGEFADNDPNTWDTPSRARMPPPENEPTKSKLHQQDIRERSGSPGFHHHRDQQHQQHKSRFQVHKQVVVDNAPEGPATIEPLAPSHEAGQTRQDVQPAPPPPPPPPFSSKISSYHESSSEEEEGMPQPTTARPCSPSPLRVQNAKRPRTEDDLDFSPDDITGKTMADVDAVPFTTDPSCPPPAEPALDPHGNPMSLGARLTNLTRMRQEDQRHLFRSLTDAEREQTAAWFLEKFQADVRKLMDARFERRKTALRYELEVKKRDARVGAKQKDVDEELAGLRKGGGELIAGKSAASAAGKMG